MGARCRSRGHTGCTAHPLVLLLGLSRKESGNVTDRNDLVAAIAAMLYANRATDDAIRAEPPIEALADEAWDLYYKFERVVRTSSHRDGDDQGAPLKAT